MSPGKSRSGTSWATTAGESSSLTSWTTTLGGCEPEFVQSRKIPWWGGKCTNSVRESVTCWGKLTEWVGVDNCDGRFISPLPPLPATLLLSAVLFCWKAYKGSTLAKKNATQHQRTTRQRMPSTNCILLWRQMWVWLPALFQVNKGLRNLCLGSTFVFCLRIEYFWLDLAQRWKLTWTCQLDCEVRIRNETEIGLSSKVKADLDEPAWLWGMN